MKIKTISRLIILLLLVVDPSYSQITFPDTPQGKIANAFIDAFNSGSDEKLKEFFLNNVSEEGLKQRSADARVERNRQLRNEMKSFTVQNIIAASEKHISVVVKNGTGEMLTLGFEFATDPAVKFSALRIEMGDMQPDELGPPMMKDDFTLAADKFIGARVRDDKFSGAVLVARDTSIIFSNSYGMADKRFGAPNRFDTKFNLGSINKFFTRIAIAQLLEKNKLTLENKIIDILPDYPNKPVAEKVTVNQLLEMTSGLGDFFNDKYESTPKNNIRTLRDYLKLFSVDPLLFEPGSQRQYSNAGYIVLGLIIEKLSGTDYYSYVRENIFLPCGMTNTDSYEMDAPVQNIATGYTHPDDNGKTWISNIYSAPGRGSSAGGGYSTVGDLHSLLLSLQKGKMLSAKYLFWLLNGDLPESTPTLPIKKTSIGIAGGAPGINAAIEYDANRNNIVIVLGNYDPPAATDVAAKLRSFMKRFVE